MIVMYLPVPTSRQESETRRPKPPARTAPCGMTLALAGTAKTVRRKFFSSRSET
jgi:hypothetical protein